MCCCNKFILFTTNTIIFVLGVVVVGIASATINKGSEYGDLLKEGVVSLPIGVLILGLVICIIGFLGCFGALNENKCMLYTYSGIILVLFIAEIALAIVLIANPDALKDSMEKVLNDSFEKYNSGDEALKKSIDLLQQDQKCCGVNSYTDWTVKFKTAIPDSCCKTGLPCGNNDIYKDGCLDKLVDQFKGLELSLGIAGIVLAIFMFFSMTTACGLARSHA